MRRKLVIVGVGFGVVVLGLVTGVCHRASSPAQEHISALSRLRYPPTIKSVWGYVSPDYLVWNLQGGHSDAEVNERKDKHREALVGLGYLRCRKFTLQYRELADGMELQELQFCHRRACEAKGLGAPLTFWSTDWSRAVTLTARPSELAVFEEVLREFDSTNPPPNQHLQPTPR